MVNLLFISNSAKIETIKIALQPLLKVKIDIVADFDYGLKDVFEKRPATVFIQDQIAGVTGESVARHIQMLLGNGAPSFIFMHEGSSKAKLIKGLFEYLIDLSQTDSKIVVDIQATLKSLLGPQWEKIYIPPKNNMVSISVPEALSDESTLPIDQPVVDFPSDRDGIGTASSEKTNSSTEIPKRLTPVEEPFSVVSSPHDQLAEMLAETNRKSVEIESTIVKADEVAAKSSSVLTSSPVSVAMRQNQQSGSAKSKDVATSVSVPADSRSVSKMKDSATLVSQTKSDEIVSSSDTRNLLENPQLQQSLPADFIIVRERPIDDVAPEDLLRVFEGKYNSNSGGWKLYVAIGIILAISFGGGIWFLLKKKPFLFKSISNSSDQSVVVVPAVKLPVPVMTDQKSVEQVLPSFIPQSGADSSFSSQNPGWERYVDKTSEYRLYRDAGRIKALQVLGIKTHEISEQKMKSILIELLGDGEYREKSSELKHGYQVSQATVSQKTDLLIYRKNQIIRAFVVSLD